MVDKFAVVPVATFQSSVAGHACANALSSQGVHAKVVGDYTSEFRAGSTGGVEVLVSEGQLEYAKTLIAKMPFNSIASQDLDDGEADTEDVDSEEYDFDERDSSISGWRKFVIWSLLGVNIAGVFAYVIAWLFAR